MIHSDPILPFSSITDGNFSLICETHLSKHKPMDYLVEIVIGLRYRIHQAGSPGAKRHFQSGGTPAVGDACEEHQQIIVFAFSQAERYAYLHYRAFELWTSARVLHRSASFAPSGPFFRLF